MNDLYNNIQQKIKQLDTSVKMLRKTGSDYGNAYAEYRVALAKELLILKDEGYAITLARDIAEVVYNANQESINSLKLQLRLLDEQLSREWGNTKNE